MIVTVLMIFLSARVCAAASTLPTGIEVQSTDGNFNEDNSQRQNLKRILNTGTRGYAPARDPYENQPAAGSCDRWFLSIDGRIQCFPKITTASPLNEVEETHESSHPGRVFVSSLPSVEIPILSSWALTRTSTSPPSYRSENHNGDTNNRKPAKGHEETLVFKPVVLEPVHIVPKPIVVHKPVFVPKPIEIPLHKPVLVHQPIEIHHPAVIQKPVEIPIHKPVFIEKPFEITVHKPVVHKPEEHHPYLSQILRQHLMLFLAPQQTSQTVGLVGHNINTPEIESSGYGGAFHQTGYVSAHDSEFAGSQGQRLNQNADKNLPEAVNPFRSNVSAPSPVMEFHRDIGATEKFSLVNDSNSSVKIQTYREVDGGIKTINKNEDELLKEVFSDGNKDLKQLDISKSESNLGSPMEVSRKPQNLTLTTNLGGSRSPEEGNSDGIANLERNRTSFSSPQIVSDERSHPTLSEKHALSRGEKANESENVTGAELGEGPDVVQDTRNEEDEELRRTIRAALGVPFDDILREKLREGTILDRTTLLEIMTALKDQYLKNAEPDQRKIIEDAFNRLYCSVHSMKQLEERTNWKKMDGSKKAALELLTERPPVDVDEWDYYSDAADDVSAEPSFLELLNVATKHKGKQAEVNR